MPRSYCHPLFDGSALASVCRIFRLALNALSAPSSLPWAVSTSPSLIWLTERSRCLTLFDGSALASVSAIFRLALSTAVLFDRDLVVTDVRRIPSDYVAMGLPVREASLHYRQADGYVHAVDLRTIGRPAWRTSTTVLYFRLMGLRTLRHVGTADHLHVSLPMRE